MAQLSSEMNDKKIKNSSSYFRNVECEYFPCHKVSDSTDFNCMFCFCPLYNLVNCGGNPRFTDKGIKDCSNCIVPHKAENYRYIMEKIEN